MKGRRTVGIIGLGIMGSAFAENVLKSSWRVIGYDIDKKRNRALGRLGVEIAPDAAAVAAATPRIITSLPHPAALEATVAAIVGAKLSRRVLIEMSTFALDDKLRVERALAQAGHTMLDCPVSGTGSQAKTKDIVVYASGDHDSIKRLSPLFKAFARAVHDLGEFGNGSRMKFVVNLLVAIHNVASAEARVLGMKAGFDPQVIHDMVRTGAGNSRIFELRAPMMVKDRYVEPTMKVEVWQKDMQVIDAFARSLGCPTPLFAATRPVYNAALAIGHAAHDTASVCAVLEAMAGVKRRGQRRTLKRS